MAGEYYPEGIFGDGGVEPEPPPTEPPPIVIDRPPAIPDYEPVTLPEFYEQTYAKFPDAPPSLPTLEEFKAGGVVSMPEYDSALSQFQSTALQRSAEMEAERFRGTADYTIPSEFKRLGYEIIQPPIETALATGQLLSEFKEEPISKTKEVVSGLYGLGEDVYTGLKTGEGMPQISESLKGSTFGGIVGEAGLILGGGYLGGKVVRGVERVAGLPRYSTRFVSEADELGRFKTIGQTQRTGLFGDRQFLSGSFGQTKFLTGFDDSQYFLSGAIGSVREYGRNIFGGKTIFRKPRFFASAELGAVTPEELAPLISRGGGLTIRYPAGEGFAVRSVGKGVTFRNVGSPSKADYFLSKGYGFPLGEDIVSGFVTSPISKAGRLKVFGRGSIFGITRTTPSAETMGNIIFGSGRKTALKKSLLEGSLTPAIQGSVERAVRKGRQITSLKTGAVVKALPSAKPSPPLSPSVAVEETKLGTSEAPAVIFGQPSAQPPVTISGFFDVERLGLGLGLSQGLVQEQEQRLVVGLVQIPRLIQQPRQAIAITPALRQAQRLATRQRLIARQIPRTPTTPRIKIPTPKLWLPKLPKPQKFKFKGKRKGKGLFFAELRRFGRWIPTSLPTERAKAVRLGLRRARQTLGASIRLRELKEPKPIKFIRDIPIDFRKSKKSPLIWVQRREKRLSSPLEVSEIKKARWLS